MNAKLKYKNQVKELKEAIWPRLRFMKAYDIVRDEKLYRFDIKIDGTQFMVPFSNRKNNTENEQQMRLNAAKAIAREALEKRLPCEKIVELKLPMAASG